MGLIIKDIAPKGIKAHYIYREGFVFMGASIYIESFGPINKAEINLEKGFQILIGPQASGKSTLCRIAYFCRKLRDYFNKKAACIKSNDTRQEVVCDEKHKIYKYRNTTKTPVINYHMDGGIVDTNEIAPRCDYLIVTGINKTVAVLLELKGTDVPHAMRQIDASLDLYPQFFRSCSKVHARIIATQVMPNIKADPKRIRLVKKLQCLSGTLKIQTLFFSGEKDTDLA